MCVRERKEEREEKGKIQKKRKIVLSTKRCYKSPSTTMYNFYTKTFVGHTNLLYIPKAKKSNSKSVETRHTSTNKLVVSTAR